jgi:5-formyltetrahydrofolate cyclo-ligase
MVKRELRAFCLKKLLEESKKNSYYKDKLISKNLSTLIKRLKPKTILFYLPLELEVDLRGLMQELKRKKIKVLLPKVQKESFKMVEYRLPLEENSFKILEPKSSYAYKRVDLIIAPIIAMDADKRRVGFGKGMYDRFYERLGKKPKVVFIQRVPCLSKSSVCKEHDIACDYYISSKEKKSR